MRGRWERARASADEGMQSRRRAARAAAGQSGDRGCSPRAERSALDESRCRDQEPLCESAWKSAASAHAPVPAIWKRTSHRRSPREAPGEHRNSAIRQAVKSCRRETAIQAASVTGVARSGEPGARQATARLSTSAVVNGARAGWRRSAWWRSMAACRRSTAGPWNRGARSSAGDVEGPRRVAKSEAREALYVLMEAGARPWSASHVMKRVADCSDEALGASRLGTWKPGRARRASEARPRSGRRPWSLRCTRRASQEPRREGPTPRGELLGEQVAQDRRRRREVAVGRQTLRAQAR